MSVLESKFPCFRERFWRAASWQAADSGEGSDSQPGPSRGNSPGKGLTTLDLRALPREEGPPSELQARREKFAFFEKQCSEVAEGLMIGSDAVARTREILRESRVTHVVNCVGFLYPAYFKDELAYKVLYLQDTPGEDISCLLYEVFDFIEAARSSGGRVLVHCSQGVSRSATLVIAYLMWKLDQPYDDVYQAVKAIRGVANPNIGFTCQLLNWHKRRASPVEGCRLYRIAPQCAAAPLVLVPRAVSSPTLAHLDPRGAFLLQTAERTFVWQGSQCPPAFLTAAQEAAARLARYEGAAAPAVLVKQGQEPVEMLSAVRSTRPSRSSNASTDGSVTGDTARRDSSPLRESLAHSLNHFRAAPNEGYDRDFQMYAEAVAAAEKASTEAAAAALAAPPGSSAGSSSGSAAGGAAGGARHPKTPRGEAGSAPGSSPNERQRKYRRSDVPAADAGDGAGGAALLRRLVSLPGGGEAASPTRTNSSNL